MPKKVKKFPTIREVDKQLHEACRALSPSKIEKAIMAGADVNAPDCKRQEAPIDMVVNNVIDVDREHYFADEKKQEKVHEAIDILLQHGASPNGLQGGTDTPLYWFAWLYFDLYIVRRLCRAGADVNELHDGRTLYDLTEEESIFLELDSQKDYPRKEECLRKLEQIQKVLRYYGAKSSFELKEEAGQQAGD